MTRELDEKLFNAKTAKEVDELVKLGANVNARLSNNSKQTPLILACIAGNIEVANALIEAGADVNAKGDNSMTPLIWACFNNQIETIKILLKNKNIDTNAQDDYGMTALMWAAQGNVTEIVDALLEREDININITDKLRKTALIWACEKKSSYSIKAIIKAGIKAEINFHKKFQTRIKDKIGRNALSYYITNIPKDDITKELKKLMRKESINNTKEKCYQLYLIFKNAIPKRYK